MTAKIFPYFTTLYVSLLSLMVPRVYSPCSITLSKAGASPIWIELMVLKSLTERSRISGANV